jgi:hypothetical protein
MKRTGVFLGIITAVCCLASLTTVAQNKMAAKAHIRTVFKVINADSSMTKKVLEEEAFLGQMTDGGGTLTGFYKAGQLRKIASWVGLSNGNEIFEFYFENNQLIFVYELVTALVYDENSKPVAMDVPKHTFEGRYYFADNKLVDAVTTGHNRFEDNPLEPQKTLLEMAGTYKKLLAGTTIKIRE